MPIHVARYDHDARRMLACRRFDAHAAVSEMIDIGDMFFLSLFLEEFLHVAEGRLIRNRLDGACAINIILAEKDFRILMGDWLIGAREVQVNIWYFVAVETEEDRKGDIMPILQKRRTADRADLVRQVIAAAVGTVCNELAILAMWATPMRRQRIDLCDAGHRRDEG